LRTSHERRKLTGLLTFKVNNATGELSVDVQRFFARHGMSAHDRMNIFHWFSSHNPTALSGTRKQGLFNTRMHSLERAQKGDE
jgi:hypothetical protein